MCHTIIVIYYYMKSSSRAPAKNLCAKPVPQTLSLLSGWKWLMRAFSPASTVSPNSLFFSSFTHIKQSQRFMYKRLPASIKSSPKDSNDALKVDICQQISPMNLEKSTTGHFQTCTEGGNGAQKLRLLLLLGLFCDPLISTVPACQFSSHWASRQWNQPTLSA